MIRILCCPATMSSQTKIGRTIAKLNGHVDDEFTIRPLLANEHYGGKMSHTAVMWGTVHQRVGNGTFVVTPLECKNVSCAKNSPAVKKGEAKNAQVHVHGVTKRHNINIMSFGYSMNMYLCILGLLQLGCFWHRISLLLLNREHTVRYYIT